MFLAKQTAVNQTPVDVETAELEIFLVIDNDGDFAIRGDEAEAYEAYAEEYGGEIATKCFKLNLNVPLPKPVEIDLTLTDDQTTAAITIS